MKKIKLTLTFTTVYEPNDYFYPGKITVEEMIANDVEHYEQWPCELLSVGGNLEIKGEVIEQ